MTEEEARTKWCPHSRIASEYGGFNRSVHEEMPQQSYGTCVGSSCMAWREGAVYYSDGTQQKNGYCGLAGEP